MSAIAKQLQRLEVFFSTPSEAFKKEVEFATGRRSVDSKPNFIKQREQRLNRARKEIIENRAKLVYNEDDDILLFVRMVQKNKSAC
jgi:hypothetical protein